MRTMTRLSVGVAFVATSWALPGLVSSASASTPHAKPTITAQSATFHIPAGSKGTWLLRLWTMPKPSTLVGHDSGKSGTLTVATPSTSNCEFQADVLNNASGTFKWYSGAVVTVSGCGTNP